MATVQFWEKPGCKGNAAQRATLVAAGHEVVPRDLLAHPWTGPELWAFLGDRPVPEWFNRTAPRVKSGEVVPEALEPDAALRLLCADPILIRRPLLQVGERREAGFDAARIDAWIGLRDAAGARLAAADGVAACAAHGGGACGGHAPGEDHGPHGGDPAGPA